MTACAGKNVGTNVGWIGRRMSLLAGAHSVNSASRIDACRWGDTDRSKGTTIFLMFVTGGIGALCCWLRLPPQLLADTDT